MDDQFSHRKPAENPEHGGHHGRRSPTELLSSAKVIAEAGQAAYGRQMDKVDKARVAGAAEDLLSAANQYGKLEERGFGEYVKKAEGYLHSYHSSSPGDAHTAGSGGAHHSSAGTHETTTHHGEPEEGGSGGYGDYLKMAQGFLNKPAHEGKSEGESGYGDYMKLAQGFLKKN
ncbi:nodulin-related protein 1 [Nymphaea colorata]|nr:nodulin-related protein 1 [Nymphaea colorata]